MPPCRRKLLAADPGSKTWPGLRKPLRGQKERKDNGLVSGLQDQRYVLSRKMGHEIARGQTTDGCKAVDEKAGAKLQPPHPPPPLWAEGLMAFRGHIISGGARS